MTALLFELVLVTISAAFNPMLQPVWKSLRAPWNVIVIITVAIYGVVMGSCRTQNRFVRFLLGLPFAVVGIMILCLLALMGTMVVQIADTTGITGWVGLRDVFHSAPFVTASLLTYISLALVIGKRLRYPKLQNTSFLINHVGMIIVMSGMMAQPGCMQEGTLQFRDGSTEDSLVTRQGISIKLPVKVQLSRFVIERYPPRLAIGVVEDGTAGQAQIDTSWVSPSHHFSAEGINVTVNRYIPSAVPADGEAWKPGSPGIPAVYVTISDASSHKDAIWLALGTRDPDGEPQDVVLVGSNHYVQLCLSDAKSYRSDISLRFNDGRQQMRSIMVNHPVYTDGWMLYQQSWGEDQAGPYSVILAVQDYTTPVVFVGLALMVAGSFMAFWRKPLMPPSEGSR